MLSCMEVCVCRLYCLHSWRHESKKSTQTQRRCWWLQQEVSICSFPRLGPQGPQLFLTLLLTPLRCVPNCPLIYVTVYICHKCTVHTPCSAQA